MNVLIACEESQEVCKAFRALGHNAFSCDLQEPSGGHPEWHILGDVRDVLLYKWHCLWPGTRYRGYLFRTMDGERHEIEGKWDLIIAHPPCTYLTVSGNRWFNVELYGDKARERALQREEAAAFFMVFANADCDRIAIENPVGVMSTRYRKPDQIIQPWQFGHGEQKATCLWLKGIPPLRPTNIVEGRTQRVWKEPPGPDRAKIRSKTYTGIAQAMAEQWGGDLYVRD